MERDPIDPSRRHVVCGLATAVAATVAAAPALAQPKSGSAAAPPSAGGPPLVNPATAHPRPPLGSSEATDITGQVFGASGGRGVP